MRRNVYVYGYEAEPADERPTGFGETGFDPTGSAVAPTSTTPWTASAHSTFDEPSRALDRIRARRAQARRRNAGLAGVVLLAIAIIASAAALALNS